MIRQWLLWTLLPLLFCLTLGGEARALTVSCTYETTEIKFGLLNVFNQAPTATGSLKITCTGLTSGYSAKICIGVKYLQSTTAFQLAPTSSPAAYDLTYQIYTTDARGTSWPQGTQDDAFGNWPFVLIPTNNTSATKSFYASITPNQTWAKAGEKTATLEVTLRVLTYNSTEPSCSNSLPLTKTYVNVSAEVTQACNIAATPMIFPTQSVITTDVLTENHLTIQCTMDTSYWVSLDNGLYYDGAKSLRQMKHEDLDKYIAYDLFRDSSRRSRWGLVVKGIDPALATCNCVSGYSADHTVYGKIPKPDISPHAGLYKDTITATVEF